MEVETCSLFLDDGQEGLLGGDLTQTGDVMFSVVWGGDSRGGGIIQQILPRHKIPNLFYGVTS